MKPIIILALLSLCLVSTLALTALTSTEASLLGQWQKTAVINSTGFCQLADYSDISFSDSDYFNNGISVLYGDYLSSFAFVSTDPLTWQSPDGYINISYIIPDSDDIGTLMVSYEKDDSNCFYSFQKISCYISGTWIVDSMNTEIQTSEFPQSFTITNYNNLYMTISASYVNSTITTNYFYTTFYGSLTSSPVTAFDGLENTTLFYVSNTSFRSFIGGPSYSLNESYYSSEGFIGNWNTPQYTSNTIRSECCVPESAEIFGTGSIYQLYVELFFNETILDLPSCSDISLYEESDYVPLNFSGVITSNGMIYSSKYNSDLGQYSFSLASSGELLLNFSSNCGFTMSQSSTPNSKSSYLSSSKMISFVVAIIMGL